MHFFPKQMLSLILSICSSYFWFSSLILSFLPLRSDFNLLIFSSTSDTFLSRPFYSGLVLGFSGRAGISVLQLMCSSLYSNPQRPFKDSSLDLQCCLRGAQRYILMRNISNQINISVKNIYFFYQRTTLMIRVEGLLKPTLKHREISIQTDEIDPKGGLFPPMSRSHCQSRSNYLRNSSLFDNSKSFGRHWEGVTGLNESSAQFGSQLSKSTLTKTKMEVGYRSYVKTKELTKGFKFIQNNENLLHWSILKYLSAESLSKLETKELSKIIRIEYICEIVKENDPNDDSYHQEVIKFETDVMRIIDFSQAFLTKYDNTIKKHHQNKKVAKFVQTLLREPKKLRVEATAAEKENIEDLELYVQAYMKTHLRWDQSKKFKDQIGQLYQQLFNRYERVPFVNEMSANTGTITPVEINVKNGVRTSIKPQPRNGSIRKSGKALEKGKDLMCQSFIKLRFFNNLRKEIKTLNQDTEAIISSEMNKFS